MEQRGHRPTPPRVAVKATSLAHFAPVDLARFNAQLAGPALTDDITSEAGVMSLRPVLK